MRRNGMFAGHSGGDLYEELKRCGGQLKERRVARDIIEPCLSALSYMHSSVSLAASPALYICQPLLTEEKPSLKSL